MSDDRTDVSDFIERENERRRGDGDDDGDDDNRTSGGLYGGMSWEDTEDDPLNGYTG